MDFFVSLVLLLQHIIIFLHHQANALYIRQLKVPPYTFSNQRAHLECSYDLGSETLYSVTWYKDNEEFYIYKPKSKPSQSSHTVQGISLIHKESDSQKVILENVNLATKGVYRCDVTADAQNFPWVQAEAYMEVVVPPKSNPRITVMDHSEEKIYASGDILTLNCTSDKSHPRARLTWYINGVKIKPDNERSISHEELVSTFSTIRLELGPHHISAGQMNVRCEAVIETSGDAKHLIDLRDTQVFVQGHASTMRPSIWLMMGFLVHRIAHQIAPS